MFGPWWLGVARDLVVERQARALAEDQANMATRVHDSVLQTLALVRGAPTILNRSRTSQACAQERELRSWLFGGEVPGSTDKEDLTISAAVQRIRTRGRVHSRNHSRGRDGRRQRARRQLPRASRRGERGEPSTPRNGPGLKSSPSLQRSSRTRSRYSSATGGKASIPTAIPADRKGVTESVYGRMSRHGGTADVKSTPGEGTDVALKMPRVVERKARRAGHQ